MKPNQTISITWILSSIAFLVITFIVLIWVIGPVQSQAKYEHAVLTRLLSKSAFENCQVQTNPSLTEDAFLVECIINSTKKVWLNIDSQAYVLNRINMDSATEENMIRTLRETYGDATLSFNVFKDEFVWEINQAHAMNLLSLDGSEVLLKVRK